MSHYRFGLSVFGNFCVAGPSCLPNDRGAVTGACRRRGDGAHRRRARSTARLGEPVGGVIGGAAVVPWFVLSWESVEVERVVRCRFWDDDDVGEHGRKVLSVQIDESSGRRIVNR